MHRDIKLDNILINKKEEGGYNVKIADFGMATMFDKAKPKQLYIKCGTPGYVAPEILRGQGYDHKCDLFSTGSLLFNLLTGFYLFAGDGNNEILKSNKKCDLSQVPTVLGGLSKPCQSFLFELLKIQPN
jgi:calcium/calmodulin-dependent protein kinase I